MCKYLAWRSRSSGCLESCDIGFQKAGMQVKLFLECSQSPNILRRKFRPTIGSSNDRSEKSKKSECVKCGSVYTVQYLGRKKEGKKNNKNYRKNVQVRNLSTSYKWKSSRCQRWGAQSRTWAHAATHSTHIGSSQSRIVAEAAAALEETSASHMHRDLKPLWTCCGWLFPRFHLFLQSARYNRH